MKTQAASAFDTPVRRRMMPAPRIIAWAATIATAAVLAYWTSFGGSFQYDDSPAILANRSIRRLWPLTDVLLPLHDRGLSVSGRPVLNLSLAFNHAISGDRIWSYHAVNLLIHVLAGLTLFGCVRRTRVSGFGSQVSDFGSGISGLGSGVWGPGAAAGSDVQPPTSDLRPQTPDLRPETPNAAAFFVALLWTLHPLQTESVTYIIQRAEALMGLFFLLTLYGFIRSTDSAHPRVWRAASIGACLLGVGCKEVIVTAPVLVWLYDRTFVAGSFRMVWQQRRWYYAGLLGTWLPLAWVVLGAGGDRGGAFVYTWEGFSSYWLTQFEAVTRYLQLSFWPHPLVFEYGFFKVNRLSEVAGYAVVVLPLLAATWWALRRRPALGFLGAWFFVILAPSSLMPGTTQMIVEHRMYLPLAAVIVLAVAGLQSWTGRRLWPVWVLLALACGGLTARRNRDYASEFAIWNDTLAKRPQNERAWFQLGNAHAAKGEWAEAAVRFEEALRRRPGASDTHNNLGLAYRHLGRTAEARAHYEQALQLRPGYVDALNNLADEEDRAGDLAQAQAHYEAALRIEPHSATARNGLGNVFAHQGKWPEAAEQFRRALALDPASADYHGNLGAALAAMGRTDDAVAEYELALQLDPGDFLTRKNFGAVLMGRGRWADAMAQYQRALELQPGDPDVCNNLGVALMSQGRLAESAAQFETAIATRPIAHAERNLGVVLTALGRGAEALPHFERALRLKPDYAEAELRWAMALLSLDRPAEAGPHLERAVTLDPASADAQSLSAEALARAGQLDAAGERYREALRLNPNHVDAHFGWSAVLRAQGRLDEAERHRREAIRLDPGLAAEK